MSDKKTQTSGDDSVNLQANVINFNSWSRSELKDMMLDVFKANAIELGKQAANAATARADEFFEVFIEKMASTSSPGDLAALGDVDFQHTALSAGTSYSRTGSTAQRDTLVGLLIEKSRSEPASRRSVAVTEAVESIRKISADGLKVLTALFLLLKVKYTDVASLDGLMEKLRIGLIPVAEALPSDDATYEELSYAGAIRLDGTKTLTPARALSGTYPGILQVGFTSDATTPAQLEAFRSAELVVPLGDKWRVNAYSRESVPELARRAGLELETDELLKLLEQGEAPEDEAKKMLILAEPRFEKVLENFSGSMMKSSFITNIGVAIAHAELTRIEPTFPPLSIWL